MRNACKILVRVLGFNEKLGDHAARKLLFLNKLYKSTGTGILTGFSWHRRALTKIYCKYVNEILGPTIIEESLD